MPQAVILEDNSEVINYFSLILDAELGIDTIALSSESALNTFIDEEEFNLVLISINMQADFQNIIDKLMKDLDHKMIIFYGTPKDLPKAT